MDTTTIVIFFAVIVLVSIAIIVISQFREKAKIERARTVKALEDSYHLTQRLLSELPPQYLSRDLKTVILIRAEDVCRELQALKTSLPVSDWQNQIKAHRQRIEDGADEKSPQRIDTPQRCSDVKQLLQSLFKMIERQQKKGRLEKSLARKLMSLVLFLIHKTQADMLISQARDLIRNNQLRKAIHCYHLASTELGKIKDHPMAIKSIKSYRTRIKELEATLAGSAPQKSDEEQQRLDKEWDTFAQEDEWKKKADYDQ